MEPEREMKWAFDTSLMRAGVESRLLCLMMQISLETKEQSANKYNDLEYANMPSLWDQCICLCITT